MSQIGYFERAKLMHERGETFRAVVLLVEGLRRNPDNPDAVEWLLHLYVDELTSEGLELEILQILDAQSNGLELYEIVLNELQNLEKTSKIKALMRVREREQLVLEDNVPDASSELLDEHDEAYDHAPDDGPWDDEASYAASPQVDAPNRVGVGDRDAGAAPRIAREDEEKWHAFENPFNARTTGASRPVVVHEPRSAMPSARTDDLDDDEFGVRVDGDGRAFRTASGGYILDDAFDDEPIDAQTRAHFSKKRRATVIGGLISTIILIILVMRGFGSCASETRDSEVPPTSEAPPSAVAPGWEHTLVDGDDPLDENAAEGEVSEETPPIETP